MGVKFFDSFVFLAALYKLNLSKFTFGAIYETA